MPEAGSIATIFATINQAIGIGKFLRDTDKIFDQAEIKIKMSEMIDRLVDVKDHLQTNREENVALREEILRLKQEISRKIDVVFEDGKYWRKDGAEKDGPFCQKCYDEGGKFIRLRQDEAEGYGCFWRCGTCGSAYNYPKEARTQRRRNASSSAWM